MKKYLTAALLTGCLTISGYMVGDTVTKASSEKSTNQSNQADRVIPLNEGLKVAKSKLPTEFKNKIKMPKNIPFEVKNIGARTDKMGKYYAYEQTFWSKAGTRLSIRVHNTIPGIHYDKTKPKEVILKDGTKAYYLNNGYVQMLDWVDKDTGYQYMLTKSVKKDNSNVLKIEKIVEIAESLSTPK